MKTKENSGIVRCLGWCNKSFESPDKTKIRFCGKCRGKRDKASSTLSRLELRAMETRTEEPVNEES